MTSATMSHAQTADRSSSQAAIEEIPWPRSIPELLRAVAAEPFAIFFDSARPDRRLGRYSFLSASPFETVLARGSQIEIHHGSGIERGSGDPFRAVAERLGRFPATPIAGLPPFQGGAAGLFSYDLCHHVEQLPRPRFDEFGVPDLAVGLYDWVIALDHCERRAWIVSTGMPERAGADRVRRAARRLDQIRALVAAAEHPPERGAASRPVAPDRPGRCAVPPARLTRQTPLRDRARPITSNFEHGEYLETVERVIEYIQAGDVYQVNLAQRLLAPQLEPSLELYLRLRERNPAPFAAYFDLGEFVIASASPERFLRVREREVETRPIKGTRPRWTAPEPDMYAAEELHQSDKDRAENVMIVDLLRNDLGRVCEYGSVCVSQPLRVESFEFVHHLVSEVRGRLRQDRGPIDLLRAAFPGGSVTGAPKIRAMEIIAELEPTARGTYCGSLGYVGFDGSMDTNILIRTFTCGRGWVQFPVGGGIVAQSSPEREYEETLHKAEGMIRALDR